MKKQKPLECIQREGLWEILGLHLPSFADKGQGRIMLDLALEEGLIEPMQWARGMQRVDSHHTIPQAPWPLNELYQGRFSITLRPDEHDDPDNIRESQIFIRLLAQGVASRGDREIQYRLYSNPVPYGHSIVLGKTRAFLIRNPAAEEFVIRSTAELINELSLGLGMCLAPGQGTWLVRHTQGQKAPWIVGRTEFAPGSFRELHCWGFPAGFLTDFDGITRCVWSKVSASAEYYRCAPPKPDPSVERAISHSTLPERTPCTHEPVSLGMGYVASIFRRGQYHVVGVQIGPDPEWVRPTDPDALQAEEDGPWKNHPEDPPALNQPTS